MGKVREFTEKFGDIDMIEPLRKDIVEKYSIVIAEFLGIKFEKTEFVAYISKYEPLSCYGNALYFSDGDEKDVPYSHLCFHNRYDSLMHVWQKFYQWTKTIDTKKLDDFDALCLITIKDSWHSAIDTQTVEIAFQTIYMAVKFYNENQTLNNGNNS